LEELNMARRRLGVDAKLYFSTAWDSDAETGYDAPTFQEQPRISDLTSDNDWNSAPAGDRGQGMDVTVKTTAKVAITGKIRVDDNDPGYNALCDAYLNRDESMDVMVLNGPSDSNGARGFRGLFACHKLAEPQTMGDALYRDFSLMPLPVDAATPFQSVLVTDGAPVFTTAFAPPTS
jgi:hypothetical protein